MNRVEEERRRHGRQQLGDYIFIFRTPHFHDVIYNIHIHLHLGDFISMFFFFLILWSNATCHGHLYITCISYDNILYNKVNIWF